MPILDDERPWDWWAACCCCWGRPRPSSKPCAAGPTAASTRPSWRPSGSASTAWWVLCSILAAAFFIGQDRHGGALRPDLLLGPAGVHHADAHAARRPPHAVLGLLPLHAAAVRPGGDGGRTPLYSILIPVYAFLFIPARIAMSGDYKRFLERTAKIQAGLLICVYCLSYAPALLTLKLPLSPEEAAGSDGGQRPAAVLLRAHGAAERRPAVCLGPDSQPARDRAQRSIRPGPGKGCWAARPAST